MMIRRRYRNKVAFGFSAAVVVIAGLTGTTWYVAHTASQATQSVGHTQAVINGLTRLRADALDIELTTQNYRLTGNPALLAQRNALVADRELRLQRLRQLINDNPSQVQRFALLRAVIDERIALSRSIDEISRTQGPEAAARFVSTAPLQATRTRMYDVLHQMDDEETRLLAQRSAREDQANRTVVLADIALAVGLSLLLFFIYGLSRRQERLTEASRQALAENEERLSITLDSIGDAVLSTDTRGRVVDMNPVAQRITGWPLAEARGRRIEEVFHILHEQTRTPAEIPVTQVLATGRVHELDAHTVLITRDGSEIPIADSAAPIRDGSGQITGVVLVFRDETAARHARRIIHEQNALLEQRVEERTALMRESQEHLRNVINNVPALIAFVDADQRYVYANDQYAACFTGGPNDITGASVCEVLGSERYAIAGPRIVRALAGEKVRYDWQPFPQVWQEIHYMPRLDANGSVKGYYALGIDITARKVAEKENLALNIRLAENITSLEHVTRALRTLSAGNRSLLYASDEFHLLDSMCEAIVSSGAYRMACVWYRRDGPRPMLVPMAQNGHPGGMDEVQRIGAAGGGDPAAATAVAAAIRTGLPQVVRNIHEAAAYAPWRQFMPLYGSCIASPLRIDGNIIGALAIYSEKDDDLSDDEVALLTESVDDMAFGIAVFRARAAQAATEEAMHRLTYYDDVTDLPNGVKFAQVVALAMEQVQSSGPGHSRDTA